LSYIEPLTKNENEHGVISMAKKINDESKGFEKRIKAAAGRKYVLRLYVTGMTPRSLRAITNIKKICEEHLKGRYDLEVIDIYQRPTLAEGEQIIAAPTLIKKLPLPLRRFIGDMTSTEKILLGLDLRPGKTKTSSSV
jgi:circadian clock protein KaiB